MSSKNLKQTQHLFGELSLKTKSPGSNAPSSAVAAAAAAAAVAGANINNNGAVTNSALSSASSASSASSVNGSQLQHHHNQCAIGYQQQQHRLSAFKHESPEIHDLIRFEYAIMQKYRSTHDQHFKNIAEALRPQIEEKIRAYDSRHHD